MCPKRICLFVVPLNDRFIKPAVQQAISLKRNPSMNNIELEQPKVVSQDEWLVARKAHLEKEKALTRLRDQLSVYHFMFGPSVRDGKEGCKSRSFLVDHVDGANVHLAHHDVTFVAISRPPLSKLEPFKKRMGWRFRWVSSYGSDFNYDFHVAPTKDELAKGRMYYHYEMVEFECEEQPVISVFYKDKTGDIFHTYSSYGRGGDLLIGTYNYLDLTPLGRQEDKGHGMEWVRHHDRYD